MDKDNKKGHMQMLIPTLIMVLIAAILTFWAYSKGQGQHVDGLRLGFKMLTGILPLLIFAFIIAGMVQVLIPESAITRWIGKEAGMRGIMVGTVAGGLCFGGPYISLPLAAGLLRSGASLPTVVAFLTSWSLWAVGRLPMEIGILGWKFTFIRLASTFIFPPLAGIITKIFFSGSQ